MAVSKFQTGRTYVFTGPSDFHSNWNSHMDKWKDGKPRKCISTLDGVHAIFEDISGDSWYYGHCLEEGYFQCSTKSSESAGYAIQNFQTGHWYKWIGPKKRQSGWNFEGMMDFILDGKPHQCSSGNYTNAAFYDCFKLPSREWSWSTEDLKHFREVFPEEVGVTESSSNPLVHLFHKAIEGRAGGESSYYEKDSVEGFVMAPLTAGRKEIIAKLIERL